MKIINSILTVFSFFIIFAHSWYWAFESSNSAIYLERVEDNKRVLFETGDWWFKSNFEVSLKGELHDKDIWDKILYWKYKITEFCSNDRCYQDGTINVNGQFIYIDNYTTSVKLKVLARTPELDPWDFTLWEKIKLFFKTQ